MRKIVNKTMKRAGKLVPKQIRKKIKRSGKRVVEQLPGPIRKVIERPINRTVPRKYPLDPLGLSVGMADRMGNGAARNITGRAAAGTVIDQNASQRLYRALFSGRFPSRTPVGGRPVAGIFGYDLRVALTDAGHDIHPLVPGSAKATAENVEVLIVDLAGFTGIWSGALDPSGIGLIRELYEALEAARTRGVTCWLVMRGNQVYKHGAISLELSGLLDLVIPGEVSVEQLHFTENPGDAPSGILEIIRDLKETV